MTNYAPLLENIETFVKEKTENETTGHDWFHADRVRRNAMYIARKDFSNRNIDLFLLQSVALMHDLGDWKVNTTEKSEKEILADACKTLDIPEPYSSQIVEAITRLSFSANIEKKNELPLEGQIVQDADRLDALGAIGIARAFAFGGQRNRQIYNPNIKPQRLKSEKDYKNTQNPSINHFYEKLFLIKDLMNTKTGKKLAIKREKFMKKYLDEFYREWETENS